MLANRHDFKLEDIDDGLEINYWPNFDNSGRQIKCLHNRKFCVAIQNWQRESMNKLANH